MPRRPSLRTLRTNCLLCIGFALTPAAVLAQAEPPPDRPWPRHTIDNSSRGADGVRVADVNGDGLLDIATGWEEGGVTRVYLHPGHDRVRSRWPAVTVGRTPSVEDAVFADLDGDGAIDVLSSCEGKTRSVFVHWAPNKPERYLDPVGWDSEVIPATKDRSAWMFALPMHIDGQHGIDLVVGSKGRDGLVGWLQAPANPRRLPDWKLHLLYQAGWIMSLMARDVDADGDLDVVISDRKGKSTGVLWLENPGSTAATGDWPEHRIGASGQEVMFLDVPHSCAQPPATIITAVRPGKIYRFHRPADPTRPWPVNVHQVRFPHGLGTAKAVRQGDLDGDGSADIVYSCGNASPPKRGIVWLKPHRHQGKVHWTSQELSGPEGIKFDRIELLDLDGDSDLDVLTCEERHHGRGLGVIWFENPFGDNQAPSPQPSVRQMFSPRRPTTAATPP